MSNALVLKCPLCASENVFGHCRISNGSKECTWGICWSCSAYGPLTDAPRWIRKWIKRERVS